MKTGTLIGVDKYGNKYFENNYYFYGKFTQDYSTNIIYVVIKYVLYGSTVFINYSDYLFYSIVLVLNISGALFFKNFVVFKHIYWLEWGLFKNHLIQATLIIFDKHILNEHIYSTVTTENILQNAKCFQATVTLKNLLIEKGVVTTTKEWKQVFLADSVDGAMPHLLLIIDHRDIAFAFFLLKINGIFH